MDEKGIQMDLTVNISDILMCAGLLHDIVYATADLEDGYKKGLFTLDKFVHAVLYYDYENPNGLSEETKKEPIFQASSETMTAV